jgi:hypothetical protein
MKDELIKDKEEPLDWPALNACRSHTTQKAYGTDIRAPKRGRRFQGRGWLHQPQSSASLVAKTNAINAANRSPAGVCYVDELDFA